MLAWTTDANDDDNGGCLENLAASGKIDWEKFRAVFLLPDSKRFVSQSKKQIVRCLCTKCNAAWYWDTGLYFKSFAMVGKKEWKLDHYLRYYCLMPGFHADMGWAVWRASDKLEDCTCIKLFAFGMVSIHSFFFPMPITLKTSTTAYRRKKKPE